MKATTVDVCNLHTHPALQLRDPSLIPSERAKATAAKRITRHVEALTRKMQDNPKHRITALRVAQVDGKLWVVDGHCRLKAARAAGRATLPAQVVPMKWADAVREARKANTENRSLELERVMENEAWWRELGDRSGYGKVDPGRCAREVARMYNVDKDRPTKACQWIRNGWIVPDKFTADERDPETGWPFYTAACRKIAERIGEADQADDPALFAERQACLAELRALEHKRQQTIAKYSRRVVAWARMAHLAGLATEARRWRDAYDNATGEPDDSGDFGDF